jgi:tetratricopeptide (TPR) repeat protein
MRITDPASLIGKLIMVEQDIAQFSHGAPLHTDDNSRLEYSAPKALIESRSTQLLEQILSHRSPAAQVLSSLGLSELPMSVEDGLLEMFQAREGILEGQLMHAQGSFPQAMAKLEKVLSSRPRDYQANYVLAQICCEAGEQLMSAQRWAEAMDAYRKGIKTIEDFFAQENTTFISDTNFAALYAMANFNLGLMALGADHMEEAEEALEKSLSGELRIAQAHTNLGIVYVRSGRYDEAEKQWRQALNLNPGLVPAHMNLGALHLQQRRFSEAVEHFGHVLRMRPEFAAASYLMGVSYFEQGEWARAEREWKRTVKLNPHLIKAQRGLDLVRQKMQRR